LQLHVVAAHEGRIGDALFTSRRLDRRLETPVRRGSLGQDRRVPGEPREGERKHHRSTARKGAALPGIHS